MTVPTDRDTLWAAQNRHAWRDFEAMGAPLHIEMTLTSRVDLANLVHAASDEICRLAGIDEDSMLNLGLALREATVNAMKHGNKLVSERPVNIGEPDGYVIESRSSSFSSPGTTAIGMG